MTKKKEPAAPETSKIKTCFVVMPISDPDGYEDGHFARVYEHLIKPACDKACINCKRADEVKATNYIVIDILQRVIDSDIVVCDLSARNPNVLFELGFRQAFNLPVVLIKDKQTDRIFDIQGLRTLDYDETLRIDAVQKDIKALSASIEGTLKMKTKDVNSLVQLLGITKAELSSKTEISGEASLILAGIRDISQRMTRMEDAQRKKMVPKTMTSKKICLPNGEFAKLGDTLFDGASGEEVGLFQGLDQVGDLMLIIKAADGSEVQTIITPASDLYETLSPYPY